MIDDNLARNFISAVEMMFDGIAYVDSNGCILYCDSKIEAVSLKLSDKERADIYSQEDGYNVNSKMLINAIRRSIQEQKLIILEEVHITRTEYFECRIAPLGKNALVLILDVTLRRMEAERLKESERSKAMILKNLPGMAYRCRYDPDWTMDFVSEGCFELTGYRPESIIRNSEISFNDIINPGYRERVWRDWTQTVKDKEVYRGEYPITRVTGETLWVYEQGQALYDDQGEVQAIEGLIIDVTARRNKEKQVEYLLRHDALTGVFNRRHFLQEKQKMDQDESLLPISIIVGDIDGLKFTNDAFGTAKGDLILIEVVRLIAKLISHHDIFARIGGDDFAILMPEPTRKQRIKFFVPLRILLISTIRVLPMNLTGYLCLLEALPKI